MGFGMNRGGYDVPIVRVGEFYRRNQIFVAAHATIKNGVIHQIASALKFRAVSLWLSSH